MTEIVGAIYSLYERSGRSRTKMPTASDGLGSICPRFAWYEASAARTRVISKMLVRRMHYGNVHEDCIRDELRQLQDQENSGWRMKGSGMRLSLWGIAGRVDMLVQENSCWKLLEVKTMNPEDFRKFQAEGLIAFPRYYEQFMFYLEACRQLPYGPNDAINSGILLAENTFPLGELAAEELTLDLQCVEEMQANTERLHEIIPMTEPPLRPYTYESKQCSHCWRKLECWEVKFDPAEESAAELEESREIGTLVTEYLRYNDARIDSEESLDKVKGRIREIMDQHKLTRISVPITPALSFTITLTQVTVAPHSVAGSSYPKLSIR